MNYNELYQLKMAGQRLKKDQLLYMRDVGYNVPEEGLYVTKDYYKTHRTEVDQFVKATHQGLEWVAAHPKETLDIVMLYIHRLVHTRTCLLSSGCLTSASNCWSIRRRASVLTSWTLKGSIRPTRYSVRWRAEETDYLSK